MYISNVNDSTPKYGNLAVENKIQYQYDAIKEDFIGVKRKVSSSLLLGGGYLTPRKTSSMNFNFGGLLDNNKVEWFEDKGLDLDNVYSWLKN